MGKVDFNSYGNDYNKIMEEQHKKFGDISYYSEYKVKIIKDNIKNNKEPKILEFGCGIGRNLKYLFDISVDSEVYGFDISTESLKIAKNENPKAIIIEDEKCLYKMQEKFDLIFVAGVYHHIEPSFRDKITKNLRELLTKNGQLIIFEHNPYNPITRHLVNTCEFDSDAILIKKNDLLELFTRNKFIVQSSGYTLFFPPKLKFFSFLEKYIKWIPLGGQYYAIFKKSI